MVKLRKNNWIGGKSNGAVRDIAPARANFTARNWHLLRKQGGKSSAPAKAVAFAPQTRRKILCSCKGSRICSANKEDYR